MNFLNLLGQLVNPFKGPGVDVPALYNATVHAFAIDVSNFLVTLGFPKR